MAVAEKRNGEMISLSAHTECHIWLDVGPRTSKMSSLWDEKSGHLTRIKHLIKWNTLRPLSKPYFRFQYPIFFLHCIQKYFYFPWLPVDYCIPHVIRTYWVNLFKFGIDFLKILNLLVSKMKSLKALWITSWAFLGKSVSAVIPRISLSPTFISCIHFRNPKCLLSLQQI